MDELKRGDVLKGRYRIEKVIGQGAMAAVYVASDTQLQGARWAVKALSVEGLSLTEAQETVTLFQREASMLDRLSHPGLPRVVDAFSDATRHYLVMELISGETLDDMMARRHVPFSEGELLPLLRQLAAVLGYLHTRQPHPVIFRDLKPSNCMVTPEGKLQLIDFGIAREHKPDCKIDTMVLGTPGFCAPEQYGTSQTEPRSDIWSLGAMAWHLLSGRDPAEVGFAFPRLRTVAPNCSPIMEGIVARCLAVDPSERYPSAAELLADLDYAASPRGARDALRSAVSPGLAPPSPARVGHPTRHMGAVPLKPDTMRPGGSEQGPFSPVRPVDGEPGPAPLVDVGAFLRSWASRTFQIWWGPGSIHFPRILALLILMFFLLPLVTAWMSSSSSHLSQADEENACKANVVEIGMSLRGWHNQHGRYPESLRDVFPEGVPKCPSAMGDSYSYSYRRTGPSSVSCMYHPNSALALQEARP